MKSRLSRLGAPLLAMSLGASALTGCEDSSQEPAADEAAGATGKVGLALQLAPGVTLSSVEYAVSGNGFTLNGSVDVRLSSTFSALIGGIPAGSGYLINLSATDANGRGIRCAGSASFDIVAGATTSTTVQLQCSVPRENGGVQVEVGSNLCPVIDALTILPANLPVGASAALSATARDLDAKPAPLTYSWSAQGGSVAAPGNSSTSFVCAAPGNATVTLTVSDSRCSDSVTATIVCTAAQGETPTVRINEIESSGGVPGDWVELYNTGSSTVNLAGFVLRDNDDTHTYTLPAGMQLAPGAFLVLDEGVHFDFGLGAADSARLYAPSGTLVDSTTWTSHAATTYGRCPDGTGPFVTSTIVTKGSANACGALDGGVSDGGVDAGAADGGVDAGLAFLPWSGGPNVSTVDTQGAFASNLSGLTYEPASANAPAVLWAVQNGPSRLFRLLWNGSAYVSDANDGWSAGKTLLYPSGTGAPDAEGVTRGEPGSNAIYVAAERNNDASSVSRQSILRYELTGSTSTLTATHEWNVTADLPVAGANLGLEAVTFVPDTLLTAGQLVDERTGQRYAPESYPNHGTGLFFVGVEGTGMIYGFALDHVASSFQRIVSFSSGQPGVMGLELDAETGYLWAYCDNTCGNRATILEVKADGKFGITGGLSAPVALGNLNNEGIALAPEASCVNGTKDIFWSDDGATLGYSIRRGSAPCGRFF